MLIVLSPAKKLSDKTARYQFKVTVPQFMAQTQQLVSLLKSYSVDDLAKLMGISPKLAQLNYDRYQQFDPANYNRDNAYPAILNFANQ